LHDIEFDHHLALIDGGLHESSNIRPVCRSCHAKKSAKEHIGNSKAKRLAKAKEVHDAVVSKEAVKAESRLKSRGFPKGVRGFSKAKSARWGK
jgi:5-methylcytosine-specific restriction endonuclease McrA